MEVRMGYMCCGVRGWAAINFTVANTTVEISPSAAAKPSNPHGVGAGIGVATVVIYLIRRRGR